MVSGRQLARRWLEGVRNATRKVRLPLEIEATTEVRLVSKGRYQRGELIGVVNLIGGGSSALESGLMGCGGGEKWPRK